ncbi:UDP-glycosyltransferase TURAN [Cryptomeria japonica]|uniref:UDP-glycosyltransferase TURAN n=1 Tax=Cryptomeria japonica TaxID=3369 RepID=UPI0027D9FCE4|nr:UDP-glycosyltransferase TURAN [Cryptomeria japonica]
MKKEMCCYNTFGSKFCLGFRNIQAIYISTTKHLPLYLVKMEKKGRAAVVVLGDLGRSPRMQYHALSLARQAFFEVDIIAYSGTEPHGAVLEHPSIHLHLMRQPIPQGLPRFLYLLALPLKTMLQFAILIWYICFKIPTPDLFLVQNPPSVPTLIAVRWACWIRKSAFLIDWHNFGYTLLGLTLGKSHPLVKLYHWCEKHYGKMADGCLCVTKAMQHELAQNWGIKATVVYDRSPEFFRPTSLKEKHELFCRLKKAIASPFAIHDCCSYTETVDQSIEIVSRVEDGKSLTGRTDSTGTSYPRIADFDITPDQVEQTLVTDRVVRMESQFDNDEDSILLKENRPAVIVSSTSWTPDEDFGMLLEAAIMYDRRVAAILNECDSASEESLWEDFSKGKKFSFPRLLFIITGKGPEREKYEEKIRKLHLKRVAFRTMWLSAADYPILLGSADLGVCLHTSSSGLDLPMKVVDMFGCGLPVCAISYSCIKELVKVDENGILFASASELADQLLELFKGFPDSCDSLFLLRKGALATGSAAKWASEWEEHVMPLLTEVMKRRL